MKRIIWLALMFGFVPSLFIEYFLRKRKKLEKLNRTLKKEEGRQMGNNKVGWCSPQEEYYALQHWTSKGGEIERLGFERFEFIPKQTMQNGGKAMKKIVYPFLLVVIMIAVLAGCASIVSKSEYPVSISSTPQAADISIVNRGGKVFLLAKLQQLSP